MMKRHLPLLLLLTACWALPWTHAALARQAAKTDTAFTFVNTPVDIDVMANDDDSGGAITLVLTRIVMQPRHGTATVERNGTPADAEDDFVRYAPESGFIGRDSLRYEIEKSGAPSQAYVYIYVNTPPVARRDTFIVLPGTAAQLAVLANDTDADGDPLVIAGLPTGPQHGTAVITPRTGAPPVITFTPAANFVGRDSLRYAIWDGKNGRDTTWATIIVDTPPVARDDEAVTLPATAVEISVLANDTDANNHALTVQAISQAPAHGTAVITSAGQKVRYTPAAGFVGSDSFRYLAADPLGVTDEGVVTVVVNTPPVANDDAFTAVFETAIDLDVLANDTDADGDVLTVSAIATPPSHGNAERVDGNKKIRYTPEANFFGTDTFDYTAADGRGGTDRATVTVTVNAEASVQLIHNAPGAGAVDVYANDVRVANDLDFRDATTYFAVSAGPVQIDVTAGNAADNSNPLFSTTVTLDPLEAYVAIASGVVGENFTVLVKEDARPVAGNPNKVEFFIVHGVPDAGQIDMRQLDPNNENLPSDVLVNNLDFGAAGSYLSRDPGIYNIDATNFDNTTVYDVFRFDLSSLQGKTFVLLASGLLSDGTFTLIGFDAAGAALTPAVVTATEADAELPAVFALHGNFPNPFNPTTTIRVDLPETAEVRVEVIDVLGRRVMTVPARQVEAGANRSLRIDAASLASGTYLYRVVARTATETMVETGRMTLVK